MKRAVQTPGPWQVTRFSGGDGYAAGYYVFRIIGNNKTEWLTNANNRAVMFGTEDTARASIPKSNRVK